MWTREMDTDVVWKLTGVLQLEDSDQWHKFRLEASHQWYTPRVDTEVKLFNIFIDDLSNRIKWVSQYKKYI